MVLNRVLRNHDAYNNANESHLISKMTLSYIEFVHGFFEGSCRAFHYPHPRSLSCLRFRPEPAGEAPISIRPARALASREAASTPNPGRLATLLEDYAILLQQSGRSDEAVVMRAPVRDARAGGT